MAVTKLRKSGTYVFSNDKRDLANNLALWNRKALPDASSDVLVGSGLGLAFAVGEGATEGTFGVKSLTVALRGTMTVDSTVSVQADLLNNAGTITAAGSLSARILNNAGTIVLNGRQAVVGADITYNTGTITVGPTASVLGVINGSGTGELFNYGTIRSYGTMIVAGALTNEGTVISSTRLPRQRPGSVRVQATNLSSDGVLAGGTWTVDGYGYLAIYTSQQGVAANTPIAITRLAAGTTVNLIGTTNLQPDGRGDVLSTVADTLTAIDVGAKLSIAESASGEAIAFAGTQALTVAGTFGVSNGTIALGAITVASGGKITGSGRIDGALTIAAGGNLYANVDAAGAGGMTLAGATALSGAIKGTGTAFVTGDLTIRAGGRVAAAMLDVAGTVTLDGTDARIYGGMTLQRGGFIDIGLGKLTLSGATTLSGGIVSGGGDTAQVVNNGALSVTGAAAIGARFATGPAKGSTTGGSVDIAAGGILTIDGAVTGTGGFTLHTDGTLALGGSVARTAGFDLSSPGAVAGAAGATLTLADAHGFAATVFGFGAGDTIGLSGFAVTGETLKWTADADGAGGVLKIRSGVDTAAIHFEGAYGRSSFAIADDGHGGTLLTVAAGF